METHVQRLDGLLEAEDEAQLSGEAAPEGLAGGARTAQRASRQVQHWQRHTERAAHRQDQEQPAEVFHLQLLAAELLGRLQTEKWRWLRSLLPNFRNLPFPSDVIYKFFSLWPVMS